MAGIEKLVTNGIQVASTALQKSSGILSVATKPIEAGSEKLTGALNGLASSNCALVKKSTIPELVDETIELLNGCTRKPLNQDLSNLSPKNMVLVHATDYFPEDGIIRTTANATLAETGHINPRFKVHTAINHMVQSHLGGNWNEKQYAILMPMDGVIEANPKSSILGGELADFFVQGDVKLPKGSVVIKTGCVDIPRGKMRISDLSNQEGIRLIETSRCDTPEITNEMIKQMGYTQHNPKFYPEAMQIDKQEYEMWQDFCKKYGFEETMHSYSPWGRSEMIFDNIAVLKGRNSWIFDKKDYQKILISAIEDIKKTLPDGKKFDFDIDKLAKIIRESKTPQEASEQIAKELNICCTDNNLDFIKILLSSKSMEEAEMKIGNTGNSATNFLNHIRERYSKYCDGNFDELLEEMDDIDDYIFSNLVMHNVEKNFIEAMKCMTIR